MKKNISVKYYEKNEELLIIKKYQELILYVYNLIKKFPNTEVFLLTSDIKKNLLLGLENLIFVKRVRNNNLKLNYLIKVEAYLNIMKIYVRMAIKNKYINRRNYTAWSYKITEIDNMLNKWIGSCQRR